jgi:hypothetical protein
MGHDFDCTSFPLMIWLIDLDGMKIAEILQVQLFVLESHGIRHISCHTIISENAQIDIFR